MGACCCPVQQEPKEPVKKSLAYIPAPYLNTFSISPGDFIKIKENPISEEYAFGENLGSGGFGQVRIGIHRATNTERAIKSITLTGTTSKELDKLMKEVSILKALDHPNIIRIFEVYRNKNTLYIVTEVCKGGELFDRIKILKKFGENQAAKYMLDMVSAIMHCHDQDIVHRDLKPENLLFESEKEDARLKLIDFGTSRFVPNDKKLNKAIGTCYYIAPEVLGSEYDKKVDVWSLGVILYVMLSGSVPFNGRTEGEIFSKIKNAQVEFTKDCWRSVSDEAKMLILKMLKKKPSERLSIDQVFNDSWLQSRGMSHVPDRVLESSTLMNLANYRTESKLQKAVFSYITSQFVDQQNFSELRDVFMSVDKNGDGYLSTEEIEKAVEKFEFRVDINEILRHCDTDKNGMINYSEFLTATIDRTLAYSRENLMNAFKRFDKDGDGQISLDELKVAFGGKGNDAAIKRMIDEADTNRDGMINLEEFINHMTNVTKKAIIVN